MIPKKIYISGKITGTADYMERFAAAEEAVKKLHPGVSVINPAKVNAAMPEDTTYEQYMAMSFTMLDMCDTIYMMQGWERSDGARREHRKAVHLGLEIKYEPGPIDTKARLFEVLNMVEAEYAEAKKLEHIRNPLAYALYKVWKIVDKEQPK